MNIIVIWIHSNFSTFLKCINQQNHQLIWSWMQVYRGYWILLKISNYWSIVLLIICWILYWFQQMQSFKRNISNNIIFIDSLRSWLKVTRFNACRFPIRKQRIFIIFGFINDGKLIEVSSESIPSWHDSCSIVYVPCRLLISFYLSSVALVSFFKTIYLKF